MGCFVRDGKNGMGCYVRGDKNGMGCYVRVTKTAWDVLSGVANLCGVFCPGCKKMAWDVLSRDVLSGFRNKYFVHILLPFPDSNPS